MLRFRATVLGVTLSLLASLPAQSGIKHVRPNENYSVFAFGERRSEPDFIVVAGIEESDGHVAVCGLVFFTPSGTLAISYEPMVTRKLQFSIAGRKLAVQTGAFHRYRTEELALEGVAGCSVTREPWNPAYRNMPLIMQSRDVTIKLSEDPDTERELRAIPQGKMNLSGKGSFLGSTGWSGG